MSFDEQDTKQEFLSGPDTYDANGSTEERSQTQPQIIIQDDTNHDVTPIDKFSPNPTASMDSLQSEIDRLRKENTNLKEQSKLMRRPSVLHRTQLKLDQVQQALDTNQKEHTKLDRQKRLQDASHSLEIENLRHHHQEEMDAMQERLDQLEEENLSLTSDVNDLLANVSSLEDEMNAMGSAHDVAVLQVHREKEKEAERKNQEYMAALSEYQSTEMDLKAMVRELTEQNRKYKMDLRELNAMKEIMDRVKSEKTELEEKVERLEREKHSLSQAKRKLESDVNVHQQLLKQSRSVPASPAGGTAPSSPWVSQDSFPRLELPSTQLSGRGLSEGAIRRPSADEVDENDRILERTLSSDLLGVSTEIKDKIRADFRKSTSNIQQMYESRLSSLQQELDRTVTTEGEIETLMETKLRLQVKINTLERKVNKLTAELEEEKTKTQGFEQRIALTREKYEWQLSEKTDELNKIISRQEENHDFINELETHLHLLEDQRNKDAEKIHELEELNVSFEEELEKTEKDLEIYAARIEQLTAEHESSHHHVPMELFENEVVEEKQQAVEVDVLGKKIDEIEGELLLEKSMNEELQLKIMEAEKVRDIKDSECVGLKAKVGELEKENVDLKQKFEEIEMEESEQQSRLRKRIAELERENGRLKVSQNAARSGGWGVFCG